MQMWYARRAGRRGFSLVEMVAVLVIVAILAGAGVAGYNSIRSNIQQSQTRDLLRAVADAQQAQYRSRGAFVASSATEMARVASNEAGYAAPDANIDPKDANKISAAAGQAYGSVPVLGLAAWSATGTCEMSATFAPASGRKAMEGQASKAALDARGLKCNGIGALGYLRVSDQPSTGSVPGAPGGLSVAAGPGQLNLSWSPAATGPAASGYRIFRAVSPSTTFEFLADVVGSTSYTDTGLDQNTSYTYRIVGYNGAGQSTPSGTATGKPLDPATTTPTRPLNVTADPVQATAVTLTWKPVAGAVGYKVFRNGLGIALLDPSDANADGFATGTTFTDFSVAPGAKYNYRVDAYNVVGPTGAQQMLWSAPYAGVNVVTPPAAVPGVTVNPKAGIGDATCDVPACVGVTWTPSPATAVGGSVPDADHLAPLRGYKVYRCDGTCPPAAATGPQPGMTLAGSTNATATAITDSTLSGSTQYSYRVYAFNERGTSTSTAQATTRTAAAGVEGLTVVPAGTGKAKLSWNTATPAGATVTGYRVYKKAADDTLSLVTSVAAGTTTYTDTGLPGFAEITYVVAVVTTGEGVGLPSTPQTVVTDPAPITGITYTATTSAVSLTWPRAKGITYTVLRDDVAVGTTTIGEYTDDNLTAGTSYQYKVRATNSTGGTATSAAVTTWTRPGTATGVVAAGAGDQITLTWKPVTGATTYKVERCVGASCTPATSVADTTTASFTDTGLSLGTTYSYRVTAANTAGAGSASDVASTSTKPNAVTLSVSANPKQVNLTWTAAATATSYAVYRDGVQIAVVNDGLKFTDSAVTGGFVYAYQVFAVNDAGRSLASNTATTSTAPYAPTGLAANPGATTVALTWVSSGASKYQVYRCAGVCQPADTDLLTTINDGATKTFTDTGLTALAQYTYSVKAGNGTGWSEISSPLTVRTTLLPPTGLRLTGQSSTTIDLAWDAADGAGGYRVYRDGLLAATVSPGSSTTASLTGLAPGTKYSLTVASYTSAGESARSAARIVTTNLDAPTDLRAVTSTDTTIALAWSPTAGAAGYKVLRCAGDTCTPTTAVATLTDGAATGYTDASVTANTAYRYAVVATTTDATSASSNVITAWTRAAKPAAPVVTSVTDNSASLQWAQTANATGYRIYRDGVLAGQTAAGVTTFTDGGRNLLSPVLASVEADTTGFTPANVTRTSSGEQSWHGSYSLKLTPNNSGAGTWTTVGLGDTGGMRAGLTAGKTYTFSVYTYVPVGGITTATPALIYRTASDPTYVHTFSTVSADPNGTWQRQSVTVTLPANTTEAFLRLYHGGPGTDTRSVYFDGLQLEEGGAATAFQPGAMTGGTTHDYTLTVLNPGGESVQSAAATALLKPAPPAPPTTTGQYRAAKVDWTAVPSATSYVIQRCTGANCSTFTQVGVVNAPTLTYSDSALADNTTYGYRVIARSSAGDSAPSPTGYALTLPALAAAPTFTAITSTSVQVNWAAVPGGTAYRLYRVGVANPLYDGLGTSFVVTGLAAGTSYSFNVASGNTSGYNVVGATASVTTLPAAPTGLSETHTDTAITLQWAATAGATDYKVYLDGALKATVTGGTATTLTGLTPATAYALNVSAANASGEGPKSAVLNVTTRPVAPVSVTATAPARGSIKLSWAAVTGATSYTVYRAGVAVGGCAAVTTLTCTVTGLADATSYTFTVTATGAGGDSVTSNPVTLTTLSAPPTALADTMSGTTASLTWTAPPGTVTGYKLYRCAGTGCTPVFVANVAGTSYTDSGLALGTTYTWTVSAVTTGGESAQSDPTSGTTVHSAVTGVAVNYVTQVDTKLTVSWAAKTPATGYAVYRCTGTCTPTAADWVASLYDGSTTFTDTGLVGNTTYTYAVAAQNEAGWSALSAGVSRVTPPPAPTGLRVTGTTPTSLSFAWDAPTGPLTATRIWYYPSTGGSYALDVAYPATSATVTANVAPDTAHTVRIYAINASGASPASTGVTATSTVATPTGLAVTGTDTTQAALSWDSVPGADKYNVYRGGTLVGSTTGTTYVDGSRNQLAEPLASVEGSTTGFGPTNITVTSSTEQSFDGRYSLKITRNATGAGTYASVGPEYSTLRHQMTPGKTYTFSAYVYSPAGTTGAAPQIALLHKAAADAGYHHDFSGVAALNGTWNRISVTETLPADTTEAFLRVYHGGAAGSTAVVYVDGLQLEEGSVATDFRSSAGNLTPGTAYSYEVTAFGATSAFESPKAGPVTATTTVPSPALVSAVGGTRTVALTWTPSAGATSYSLYRCTGTCTTAAATLVGNVGNVTSYTNTALADGTTYTYHVIANGAAASSLPSNQMSALTIAAVPTGVVVNPGATSAVITWNSPDGAKYDVFRCAGVCSPTTADLIGSISTGATRTYTDTGLTALAQYTYAVRAGNASGWSALSAPVTVRTVLDMPSNVRTTAVTGTTIALAWGTSAGATGYRVYNGSSLVADIPGGTATSTTLTGLVPGTAYQLSMSAYSTAGESGKTTPLAVTTTLAAPTGVTVTATTVSTVALSWDAVDGATGYQVLRCAGATCTPTTVVGSPTGAATTTFSDTSLSSNTAYRYAVKATSAATASVSSALVTGWTLPGKPGAPTLSNITNTGATLTWPATPNATSYQVYRDGALAGTTDGATTTFTDGGRNTLDPATANIESTLGSITAFSHLTIAPSTDAPWRGTSSLKALANGGGTSTILSVGGDTGGMRAGMTAGKSYTASAFVNIPAGGYAPRLYLWWKTAAGTYAYNYSYPGEVGTGWNRIQVAGTIPGDATEAFLRMYTNQPATSTIPTYVDGFQIEEGTGTDGFNTGSTNMLTATTATQEGGLGTLAPLSGLTLSSSTEQAWQGTTSAKLVPNGVNSATYASVGGDTGGMRAGMQAGHLYNFSTYAYSPTGGTSPRLYIYWRTGTGSYLANYSVGATANGTWQLLETSALIPDTATEAFVRVYHGGAQTATTPVYVDGLKLEDMGAPSEFSPGAMTGGTNHTWTYSVSNPGGEGAQSFPASALLTPDAPATFTATGGTRTATLSWAASVSATSYTVQRCAGAGCSTGWTTVGTVNAPTTTFTDSALADGTTYGYRVIANNGTGAGPATDIRYALTLPAVAAAPTFSAVTATSVTVSWGSATGASTYRLYRTGVGTPLYDGPATSFTVTGLSAGTAYTFNVATGNASGYSAVGPSATVTTVPAVPTGLAETHTHNTATITWTGVTGATGYKVYLNGTYLSTVATATANLSGLSPTTAYSVKVAATNASGDSAQSAAVSFTTSPVPPVTPTATSPSAGTIVLSWPAATGATSYTAYRDGVAVPGCVNITALTCTVTGLADATTYSFTITVTGTGGESGSSNPLAATTLPAAPTGLTATMSGTTGNLAWTTTPGAVTGYKVYRCTPTSCTTAFVANTATNSYANTGLAAGTTYTWQVSAVTAGGEGPKSAVATGTTVNPAVTGVTVAGVGYVTPAQMTVSWTAMANTTRYGIYRCTGTCAPTTANWVAWVATGTTTFTDTTVSHSVQYSYAVASENAAGLSPLSTPGTQYANHPPLTGVTTTARTATTLTVSWDPAPNPHNYFSIWAYPTGGPNVNVTAPNGSTSATITGLAPDTAVAVDVYVLNGGGWSKQTRTNTATLLDPPTGLSVTSQTASSVALSWTGSTGADKYNVYRNGVLIASPTTTTYTDTTATAGSAYSYQVSAYGNAAAYETAKAGPVAVNITADAPVLVSATPLADGRSSITLAWNAAANASSYSVYRCTPSCATGSATLVGNVGNVTSWTNYDLASGTTYTYHVVTNSAGGTSVASNQKSALTTPGATTGLKNTAADDSVVALGWTGPSGQVDSYTVTRNGATIGTVTMPGSLVFNDTLAWSGSESTRTYTVAARNASGAGAAASLVVARPPLVTAVGGTKRIDLSWPAVPGASKYTWALCLGTAPCVGGTTDTTTLTAARTGLTDGATYRFEVTATIGTTTSAPDVGTIRVAPAAPTGVTASSVDENKVTVSWTGASGASAYDVYRGGVKVGSVPWTSTSFTDYEASRLPECVTRGGDCSTSDKLVGWTAVGSTLSVLWSDNQDADSGWLNTAVRAKLPARSAAGSTDLAYGTFPVTAGEPINVEGYTRNDGTATGVQAQMRIVWLNASNVAVGTAVAGTARALAPQGGYQRLTATGTAPVGATTARAYLTQVAAGAVAATDLFTDRWYAGDGPIADTAYTYTVVATNPAASPVSASASTYTAPSAPKRANYNTVWQDIRSRTMPFPWDANTATGDQYEVRWCTFARSLISSYEYPCDVTSGTVQPATTTVGFTLTSSSDEWKGTAQVRTKSAASGKYSAWSNAQTTEAAPAAPTNVTVRPDSYATGDSESYSTWQGSQFADNYGVTTKRADGLDPTWYGWPCTPGDTSDLDATGGYTNCKLDPGSNLAGSLRMSVEVLSKAPYRQSDRTQVFWWSTPDAPTASATQNTATTGTISWGAVTGATSYKVYQMGTWGARTLVGTTSATSYGITTGYGDPTSYVVTAVLAAPTGEQGGGEGVASNTVTLTPAPAAPAFLTVNEFAGYDQEPDMTVNWSNGGGNVTQTLIQRCLSNGTSCVTAATLTGTSATTGSWTTSSNTALTWDGATNYAFKVQQTNAAGTGPMSALSNVVKPDFDLVACQTLAAQVMWSLNDRKDSTNRSNTAVDRCNYYLLYPDTISGLATTVSGGASAYHHQDGMYLQSGTTVNSGSAKGASGTGNGTWAFSFRNNSSEPITDGNRYFWSQGDGSTLTRMFGMRPSTTSTSLDLVMYQTSSGASWAVNTVPVGINVMDGAWHDIVVTKSSSTATIYIDGTSRGTTNLAAPTSKGSGATATSPNLLNTVLRVGGSQGLTNNTRTGSYDDFVFFPTALTSAQVASLWAAGR